MLLIASKGMGLMKNKHIVNLKFLCFIVIIILSLIVLISNIEKIRYINEETVINILSNHEGTMELTYLIIFVIKPFFLVIPSNVVALVGGTLFGSIKGFVLTMIGFFVSGTIAFFTARYLGKEFVDKIVKNKLLKLDNNMEHRGFRILFLLRLPPIIPFDPLSYACGLSKISYKDFILASLLGVMPETLCYSIMGKSFTNPFSPKFILPVLFLILGGIFAKSIISKSKKIN